MPTGATEGVSEVAQGSEYRGEIPSGTDPFDTSKSSSESSEDSAGLPEPDAKGAEEKEALTREADGAAEKGAKLSETPEAAPLSVPSVTIGKPTKKTKVNLKGDLPAEPQFLRLVKNDLKSSGVAYIKDRTLALDGQCLADVIGRHFSDGKGSTRGYSWSDLSYDLACGS